MIYFTTKLPLILIMLKNKRNLIAQKQKKMFFSIIVT